MKKKKNIGAKVFAFLALFWLFVGIVWTWVLFIVWNSASTKDINTKTISAEQIKQMIKSWKIKVETKTWVSINTWNLSK